MIKYKVIDTTIDYLRNIEVEMSLDSYNIGDTVDLFNNKMTVTQVGKIFSGSNSDHAMTLMEIENL